MLMLIPSYQYDTSNYTQASHGYLLRVVSCFIILIAHMTKFLPTGVRVPGAHNFFSSSFDFCNVYRILDN